MQSIEPGTLLISDPFLKDPNFLRSVVLICDHHNEGTVGFILNKKHNKNFNDFVDGLEHVHFPVYYGGPVQLDSLHFIHSKPDLIEGGLPIVDNVFWGGDYGQALNGITAGTITPRDLRFYIGYSGWSEGQLDAEIDQKSWILHQANKNFIFHLNTEMLWKDVLKDMGGEFKSLINYPLDPQLN